MRPTLALVAVVAVVLAGCATAPPGTVADSRRFATVVEPHPATAPPTGMVSAPDQRPLRLGAPGGGAAVAPPVSADLPAVVPVVPGTHVSLAFDVRARDVRPSHAASLGLVAKQEIAEGEVVERGVVTVPLDRHGRGVGSWSGQQPYAYFGRIDPPAGRYHPMVQDLGLRLAVAVQPSPTPAHRWVRVTAILDELDDANLDPVGGTARPVIRSEQWQADLDLRDGAPVEYAFFVRPDHRTVIRLEMATARGRGAVAR